MSFQPLVGQGGYAGWRILSRTVDKQTALIAREASVARDTNHVQAKIETLKNPDELLSDYRLLKTTLSAFGLEADVNKKFFIRKVLESDLTDPKSLANRLSDKRYRNLAESFGFATKLNTRPKGLAADITQRHVAAELERRVGTVDGNLRLAMNAQRELASIARSSSSDSTRWYSVLGSIPLRKVVEGALGLSSSFAKLPIDRQLEEVKVRTGRLIGDGSPSAFADPTKLEKLIQHFLVRSAAVTAPQSSYNAALQLLR